MSKREVFKATGQFVSISEMIATGVNEYKLKEGMRDFIVRYPGLTKTNARRIFEVFVKFTNVEKGGYAYATQDYLRELLFLSHKSKSQVSDAIKELEEHNLLLVGRRLKQKGRKHANNHYRLPWQYWNQLPMKLHDNDNKPTSLATYPHQGGSNYPHHRGDNYPLRAGAYNYIDNSTDKVRDSLSANAPRESRDSRATSEAEEYTAGAVVTGIDSLDAFLSIYPLSEYLSEQSRRNELPDETKVERLTEMQLRRTMRNGVSLDNILAGARRYRDHVHHYPEFILSPQKWLSQERWEDELTPRSPAFNDNESLDKRIRSQRRAAI